MVKNKETKKREKHNWLFLIFLLVVTFLLIKDYTIPNILHNISFSQYVMYLSGYIGGGYALLKMGNFI